MRTLIRSILSLIILSLSYVSYSQVKFGGDVLISENTPDELSIDISDDGNFIIIGDPGGDTINNAGIVKVFRWNGASWDKVGQDIYGEDAGDNSGNSVAISKNGHLIAIGAVLNSGKAQSAGHVRTFEWDGFKWIKYGDEINGENLGDRFGYALDLSSDGSTLIASSRFSGNGKDNQGDVRIFKWLGGKWRQQGETIFGINEDDTFGDDVSLSEDGALFAVSSDDEDGNGSSSGVVRIFNWDNSDWVQLGDDITGENDGDFSGFSIDLSLDGYTLAIGSPGANREGAFPFENHYGQVRVYNWDGTYWIKKGRDIEAPDGYADFGISIGINSEGNKVAIRGSQYNSAGNNLISETISIYEYQNGGWNLICENKVTNSQYLRYPGLEFFFRNRHNLVMSKYSEIIASTYGLYGSDNLFEKKYFNAFRCSTTNLVHKSRYIPLSIKPNPTSDIVTITSQEPIQSISIYTLDGRMVRQEIYVNGAEKTREVNLSGLANGVYMVRVMGKEGVGVVKVVKE